MYRFLITGRKQIKIELDDLLSDKNYLQMEYKADKCLKCYLVYDEENFQGYDVEEFFLHSNENKFNIIFNQSLKAKKARYIQILNLENEDCNLEISKIAFTNKQICAGIVYIENEFLKLGVDLNMGGAICHLSSKKFKIGINEENGIKYAVQNSQNSVNLLNRYDTGRLLQQSYYGTECLPYQVGNFFGNIWRYNPVQGGDKYDNISQIIDFNIEKNKIYIKARPLDWAKNNYKTDSYMENQYEFNGQTIKVDNFFVDYSLLDHSNNNITHQEMPALYFIEPLRRFVRFVDGELCYHDDLEFWGDPKHANNQHLSVENGISGWVNENGLGVGVETPHSNSHFVGRYQKDMKYNECPEVASPVNYTAAIKSFDLLTFKKYSYTYSLCVSFANEFDNIFTKKS